VTILRLCDSLLVLWLNCCLSATFVQVDLGAESHVASLDLTDGFSHESVKRRQSQVVDIFRAASHEIVAEGYLVSYIQLCHLLLICMEQFTDHDFSKTVLVYTGRPLVNKHIVVNLRETLDTVTQRNR